MRGFKEILFRLRQEGANALLYLVPLRPQLRSTTPLDLLPPGHEVAAVIRGTAFEGELLHLADRVLSGRIPVLGLEIDYGKDVAWRRDPLSGAETPTKYFRQVPYLNPAAAGDHKLIWEVNRHQHLVLLTQAFVLSGRAEYFDEVLRQLESWWAANPFQRGINWASALEVGFRTLSWIWIWHWASEKMPAQFRQRFLAELYLHGLHLQHNLSVYFSPNTHLLGEAVALHALGRMFPEWPRAKRWQRLGSGIVRQHMSYAVKPDGSYFEQSAYYHVYALDMFLLHGLLEKPDEVYRNGLERMARFLASIVNASGELPLLGDDDGGRLFHPYGDRMRFPRGTLATASLVLQRTVSQYDDSDNREIAAWWLRSPPCRERPLLVSPRSCAFKDSGLVVMRSEKVCALFDAGPFGPWGGGHSHSDSLSLVVSSAGHEILIDPGTYSYMDAEWREIFRGTAAHNTIRIDARDQASPAGPFCWANKPDVQLLEFSHTSERDWARAACHYGGFTHQRSVELRHGNELDIVDKVTGPTGEHLVEQFWHVSVPPVQIERCVWRMAELAELRVEGAELEQGWRSRAFGQKESSPVIVVRRRGTFPVTLHARLRML